MSIFASWSNVKTLAITHLPQSPPSSQFSTWSTTLLLDPSIIQCSSEYGWRTPSVVLYVDILIHVYRENLCAMSCVSTVTSLAVVSQSRHLSIEICPPFDLAAAVHGNLVDVDVHHFYILPPSYCTDSFLRCILMQHGHLMQRQVTNMWGGEPICWSISDKKDPLPDGNLRLVSPEWWLQRRW